MEVILMKFKILFLRTFRGAKATQPYKLYILNDAMIRMSCILIGGFGVQS